MSYHHHLAVAFVTGAVSFSPFATGVAAEVTGLFAEDFAGRSLGAEWGLHFQKENKAVMVGDALEIHARADTLAHVGREFRTDLVQVACELKTTTTNTPAVLSLTWDESNFIQFGLNAPFDGRLGVREVLGTYPHDLELGDIPAGGWRLVAIQLARDCIRYLASRDGGRLEIVHISPRPERFAGAPRRLSLGQDCVGRTFARPSPWISVTTPRAMSTCAVRRLSVVPLKRTQQEASSAERRLMIRGRDRDMAGEKELAPKNDPTFESVSRHFPAMKWSREIIGVKDHPFDIGVAPDGSLQLNDNIATHKGPTAYFEIDGYRFGSNRNSCAKRLQDDWMPIVTTFDSHGGLQFEQTVFGWTANFSPDEPLSAYLQLRVRNDDNATRAVELRLSLQSPGNPAPLRWKLDVPAHGTAIADARVPFKILESSAVEISADEFQSGLSDTKAYWQNLIMRGSRFEIPERRIQDAYRAWLAYNFLNVAKRNGVYEVCDGSGFYGKVYGYSAALYCHALDLMGYPDRAETYCDALLSFVQTNGLLAVNFGDTDTGTALWVMAEHYRLTHDDAWLRRVAPKMRSMCNWIVAQRHIALANAASESALTRGLIRYRPYADLLHPATDYFSNGYLWKGLDATARVFAEIGLKAEADELQREAEAYFENIQASMESAVFVDRGQKILPMIPDTRELWKESDGSADGYYGIIAPCLLEIGFPAANDPKAELITQALERRGGLVSGVSQFHGMADHAYTYGYWLNCLQRDDVKRAILGLYGSLAYGMSRNTYAAVECTMIRTGENYWTLPHTYSNTQQLRLLRNMLVREDGDKLWLGQAIPRDWLAAGKRVAVNEAPTNFGPVSYSIEPQPDGSMHVELSPPLRNAPKEILFRLRDPKQRRIARVKPSSPAKIKFAKETIELAQLKAPISLEVAFH